MKLSLNLLAILMIAFSFSAQAQKHSFHYNLKKGDSFSHTTISDSKVSQEMMGQKMDIAMQTTMKVTFKVTDVKDGLYTLDLTYTLLRIDQEVMGQKMLMSSVSSENTNPMFTEINNMLNAMMNIPVSFTLTKNGEVKDIKGAEKIQKAMIASLSNPDSAIATQFLDQYNEKSIKTILDQSISLFSPNNPVGIGESWEKEMLINQVQIDIDATHKMTLLSVANNIATIKIETKIGKPDKTYTMEMNGMSIKSTIKGIQNGTIEIDLRTGWMKGADLKQDLDMDSEVMGTKLPQKITSLIKTNVE